MTGLTLDKTFRVRIQKALAIDYLRNVMRMLGAASVGPVEMGTQVMSVARGGLIDARNDQAHWPWSPVLTRYRA